MSKMIHNKKSGFTPAFLFPWSGRSSPQEVDDEGTYLGSLIHKKTGQVDPGRFFSESIGIIFVLQSRNRCVDFR